MHTRVLFEVRTRVTDARAIAACSCQREGNMIVCGMFVNATMTSAVLNCRNSLQTGEAIETL